MAIAANRTWRIAMAYGTWQIAYLMARLGRIALGPTAIERALSERAIRHKPYVETNLDICRRRFVELSLGISSSTALCRIEKLQRCSFLALFCRELGRRSYGAADCRGWLDFIPSKGLV